MLYSLNFKVLLDVFMQTVCPCGKGWNVILEWEYISIFLELNIYENYLRKHEWWWFRIIWAIASFWAQLSITTQSYNFLQVQQTVLFVRCPNILIPTKRYGPLRGPTSTSCGRLPTRLFLPFVTIFNHFHLFSPIFNF